MTKGDPLNVLSLPHALLKLRWRTWFGAAALAVAWAAAVWANDPMSHFRQAAVALKNNDVERLQYDLLSLRSRAALQPHANLLTGKLLLAEHRPDAALTVLSLANGHPDTRIQASVLMGQALYETGSFAQAGEAWTRVLKADGDNVDALRWLGVAYYDLGAMLEAVGYLERAASLAPRDPGPPRLIGMIWKDLGKYDLAANAYRESLRRGPSAHEADRVRLELADCLHLTSHDREALTLLAECRPSAEAQMLRAACDYAEGRLDAASRALDDALKNDPDQVAALLLKAEIALRRKTPEAALAPLERAAALDDNDLTVHYQLATVYRRLGRDDGARREKRLVEELRPLYDKYKRLRDQAAGDPRDAQLRYELGKLAEKLRMTHDARKWLRAAIYLDPTNREAQDALLETLQPPSASGS